MMMCEQAVMDQESAYMQALGEAKTFAVKGDQLTLTGGDGVTLGCLQSPIPGFGGNHLASNSLQ